MSDSDSNNVTIPYSSGDFFGRLSVWPEVAMEQA